MKTLILVLLACGLTGAQATPMTTVKNKIVTAKELRAILAERKPVSIPKNFAIRKGKKPAATPVVPIRDGKFKGEIQKVEIKKLPDGTYWYGVSNVCIVNGSAPIFDLRGLGMVEFPPTIWQTCATTVGGQPAEVSMTGTGVIQIGRMFSDEAESDFKMGFPELMVMVGANMNQFSSGFEFTRDLSQKSMLGYLGAESIQVCAPAEDGSGNIVCTTTEGEYFSANFELLD